MMDSFAQILQRLPRGDASASSRYSGNATPFKVQVNSEIPIFKGKIDADAVDKWLNLLDGYFFVHEFSSREKIVFALLKAAPHVKDWWETYCEQKDESTGSLFLATPTWNDFQDAIKEQYYPVKSYEEKYIKWTTLRQGRDQDVPEFTNIFHTLRTQLAYRYAVKIEQKFKQKKRDFGCSNPKPKGQSQGGVTQDNSSKPQEKNNTTKLNKDTGKWCEFPKSPTHNTSECRTKHSLVAELQDSKSDTCSDPELEPDKENGKGKQIIDADPSATVATAKIQKNEPEEPEEGERLFHSQMWVNGLPLQFIVDSGSQKNLISAKVVKRLGLLTTPHPQPYSIGWLHEGRDLKLLQQCCLPYSIKPFTDEVLCDVTPLDVCDVLLGHPYLWRRHVVYESRPCAIIISLSDSLYRIPVVAPATATSLITAKKGSKLISQTRKFLCMVHSQSRGRSLLHP
eukprot:PITA_22154